MGGRDWEDHGLRPPQVKSWGDSISTNKPIVVVHVCNLSYVGDIGRRIKV
jgi:hypothetical protein